MNWLFRTISLAALTGLLAPASLAPAALPAVEVQQTVEHALQAGNQLMEAKKYCEALGAYREGLAIDPTVTELLYNGGLAALQCRDWAAALDLLTRLKAIDAEDWQVRAKLVQTYQALGKVTERDKERTALFEMHKRGSDQDLAAQAEYCRDRFEAGGEQVMAFEHFELKGERAVRYIFDVMNEAGDRAKYQISLGSYESTNRVWRETTKPEPPPDVRLFHLDRYWDGGHATYTMFAGEPTYDEVRALVVKILKKEVEPASMSTFPSPAPKKL